MTRSLSSGRLVLIKQVGVHVCGCVWKESQRHRERGGSSGGSGGPGGVVGGADGEGHTCGCGERLGEEAGAKRALLARPRSLGYIFWVRRSRVRRRNEVRSMILHLIAVYRRVYTEIGILFGRLCSNLGEGH